MANPYKDINRGGIKNTEHRLIAERAVGHALPSTVQIHHVNGDGRDNAHSNLVICENQSYHRLLHWRQHIVDAGGNPDTERICPRCSKIKVLSEFRVNRQAPNGYNAYCHPCQHKYDVDTHVPRTAEEKEKHNLQSKAYRLKRWKPCAKHPDAVQGHGPRRRCLACLQQSAARGREVRLANLRRAVSPTSTKRGNQ